MEVGKEVSKTRPDVTRSPKRDRIVLVGRVEELKINEKCLRGIQVETRCCMVLESGLRLTGVKARGVVDGGWKMVLRDRKTRPKLPFPVCQVFLATDNKPLNGPKTRPKKGPKNKTNISFPGLPATTIVEPFSSLTFQEYY